MCCPYFEIQKSEDYENISSVILADKETKHFVRHRRYARACANDGLINSAFDKKVCRSQSGYFSCLRFFSIIFPLMIAVSICVLVTSTPENRIGLIPIPLTTFGIGIVWAIFLFFRLTEFAFVKSRNDLFIAYDKEGEPYSVEVSKKRVRVLYRNLLYIIKGKKIKTIKSERKLYYAYLNMFPQCVLNMEKYVDNSDRSTEAVFIPDINYCEDGQCVLSLGKPAYKQNQNLPAGFEGFCPKSLLRHLNFYNYIFTVDNELQIISVYSAARQNAVIGYT